MQPISGGPEPATRDIGDLGRNAANLQHPGPGSGRPEGIGDPVVAREDEVGHDLAGKGGEREADLEAAIGDELAGMVRMGAKQRLPAGGARTDAGPARDDGRRHERRTDRAGPRDHGIEPGIGGRGVEPVLLGGRADGGGAVAMGHDVQPFGIDLGQVARVMGKKRRLPLYALAERGRPGKAGMAGGMDDRAPGRTFGQDAPALRGERGGKRCKSRARCDAGGKRVVDNPPGGPRREPAGEIGRGPYLPAGRPGPERAGRICPRPGPVKRRGIGDGLETARAGKERIAPPRRGDRRPPVASHEQGLQLEGLGLGPVFRRMGGERADDPAAGPGAGAGRVDDGDARPPPGGGPGEREAEDAGAKNGDIGQRVPVAGKGAPGPGRGGGFTPPQPRGICADRKWGKALDDRGVDWRDDLVPVSRRFGDPYFSLQGGLAETEHVFLAGNGLPGRFGSGPGGQFRIGELGFGTGLNVLATQALWQGAGRPGSVRFTSFEAFPLTGAEMARALAAFPRLAALVPGLLAAAAQGGGALEPGFTLRIVSGDVRQTLPHETETVEAWYLDGFAPAKNPEMWGQDVLHAVAARLVPGGTVATYSAAGDVRRGLAAAGLEVTRTPGYGRKRHMTLARKPL